MEKLNNWVECNKSRLVKVIYGFAITYMVIGISLIILGV